MYKRVNAHVVMPNAHDIATHHTILDVVGSVLGPDIIIYSTEFLIKESQKKIINYASGFSVLGFGRD